MPARSKGPPLNINDLQHGQFPGDTVVVHDPPPSNMGTQDSYGDEKGIKAPPGARGEYTERPRGNYGGPGGSVGVDPMKYKVDYSDEAKRNQIPPMFLPAAAKEEIDNEDEPDDDEGGKRTHDFERGLIPELGAVAPQRGPVPGAGPEPHPGGQPDVPAPEADAQPTPTPIPLDRLNNPQEAIGPIYGITGSVTPGVDTTQQLKLYNLDTLIQNPQITEQMLSDLGFKVEVFSYDPERFRLPKLKTKGYGQDTVWIYDPEVAHGSFNDTEYTRAWRVFHEVGHGVTEDFMQAKYGPSRREGRLGVPSTSTRGVPGKQVQVEVRPLTLAEAQRAIEWEDTAFRAQKMLLEMYGVQITPQDFGKEYNVNIADALFRTMTGDFGDPGSFGYTPSDQPADLRSILALLQAEEAEIARSQGRAPTQGVDLAVWQPISDDDIRKAMEARVHTRRRAFSVYPVPSQPRQRDERLLLQIPHDVQERYSDLHRRVSEYVKNVKLNTLDMYSFPSDPPEKWVEEERGNVQVDWEDRDAWSTYMGRLSHDDVADWIGLESFDAGRLTALAPTLSAQHALETGGAEDFSSWFRTRRPAIEDRELLDYVQSTARTFPSHGLGKGYSGYWRRRNHEMVREIATQKARDRHDRYLREVDYHNHVKPNYKKSFDDIVRSRSEHMPLSDVVTSLHSLPHEGEDRDTVDGFRSELNSLVSEGTHALDLYRDPVSRDDRLYGDMQYEGEKWVPVRKIEGGEWELKETTVNVQVPLYRYGDRYFLVHESDRQHVNPDSLMIRAQVYAVIPGSSIVKQANVEWGRKSKALASAIREIKGGSDREAVFMKYGREYGPGLRKAISDYLFVTSNKKGDGGGGPPGSSFGDSTCSSFAQQTADNCKGCTFSPNMGGNEFGYGEGGCLLSDLFLNAPQAGFGRGDQSAYSPHHTPATPTVQTAPRDRRRDPRLP